MSRSKFTHENRERLIKFLKAGNVVTTSCRMVGIDPTQFYRWLRRGEEAGPGTTYRRFYDSVQAATARAEVRAMTILQQGMRDDPKWAAWYLERRVPEFSNRERREIAGAEEGEPLAIRIVWAPGPMAGQ